MKIIDNVVFMVNPDGSVRTMLLTKSGRKRGTESEYIEREIRRVQDMSPHLKTLRTYKKALGEYSSKAKAAPSKRHLKIDQSGNVYVDNTYKSPLELHQEKVQALKQKIKGSLQLSDSEVNLLLGK